MIETAAATADEMRHLAARVAVLARAGDLLVLSGPLGAGKTVFVQGLSAGLGIRGRVTSPTFVLAREHHDGRLPLVHVDAYRLGGPAEVDDLDLDSDLGASVTAVEWGGGLVEGLSDGYLRVEIDRPVDGEERRVRLVPVGGDWASRLARLDRVLAVAAVLFDLDGVLVDSTKAVEASWRWWADRHGLDPAGVLAIAHGRRSADVVALAAPHLDAAAESALVEKHSTSGPGSAVLPGAADLLAALVAAGGPRWAVVASGTLATATSRLAADGLPTPAVLVSADDVTAGKPDPEGYRAAAERLGRPPARCLVVEDAPPGIAAGHAAGATVLALLTSHRPDEVAAADLVAGDLAAVHLAALTPDLLLLTVDPPP